MCELQTLKMLTRPVDCCMTSTMNLMNLPLRHTSWLNAFGNFSKAVTHSFSLSEPGQTGWPSFASAPPSGALDSSAA
jgi:hypothetical protein